MINKIHISAEDFFLSGNKNKVIVTVFFRYKIMTFKLFIELKKSPAFHAPKTVNVPLIV